MGERRRTLRRERGEHRRFGRRTTFKPALICPEDGEPIACIIVDLDDMGAKLKLQDPAAVPDRFELIVEVEDFTANCKVVHRDAVHLGVRYITSPRRLSWARKETSDTARQFVKDMLK